jgi:hypothetical protein
VGVVRNTYAEKVGKRQTLRITGREKPRIEIVVLEVVEEEKVQGYAFTMTNISDDFGVWGKDDGEGELFETKEAALEKAQSLILEYCSQPIHQVH